jgi:L(+)-tartrate dehydratase beta subunit
MVERINGKTILTTPVSAEDLEGIKIGDIIYLNGSMTTCRDVAHRRVVEEGREIPVDVRNNAIFHAGPIIRPLENDKFEMVSVGPTTSMRMEKFEYEFVKETGVRVISEKNALKSIDLKTIFLFGGTLSLASALQTTGAGEDIAKAVIGVLGENPSPYILTFVVFMLCCVLTNFMSNTATTALMAPICVSIAQGMGADPRAVLMACVIGGSCAWSIHCCRITDRAE